MQLGTKDIVAIAIPYLVAVSGSYLFGYWGAFNINVLEFISFSDIAKLAVYPVLASCVFGLAGIITTQLTFMPLLPPGGGAHTRAGTIFDKIGPALVIANIFFILFVIMLGAEPIKWSIVAMLISFFSTPLTHFEPIIELIPNPKFRASFLFFLLLLPGLSFSWGREQAFQIKSGSANILVDVTRSKLPLSSDPKNPVAYIGFVGGTYVLLEEKTGQIVFVKQRDDSLLFLTTSHFTCVVNIFRTLEGLT